MTPPVVGVPAHGGARLRQGPYERLHSRRYEHIEICICCVVWPAVASASGILLYWLLFDSEQHVGWFSRAVSTVFIVLLVVALVCTLDMWSRLIMGVARRLRAGRMIIL